MGRKIEKLDYEGASIFYFGCPGCSELHGFSESWTFNRDFVKPTFEPSIRSQENLRIKGTNAKETMAAGKVVKFCHAYVREGMIQFLTDSTHELAGQTVELPDIDMFPFKEA